MDYTADPQAFRAKRYYVSRAYQHIPEASDLEWSDSFFEDEEGIVAVFDFDYHQIVDFNTKITLAKLLPILGAVAFYGSLVAASFSPMFFVLGAVAAPMAYLMLTLTPCLLQSQVEWEAYSQHVAVTRDGIRLVQDKRRSCWGFSVCDKGRHSKTVPFDKVTDCDVLEPAGAEFLCIPRVLTTVHVDTASSGGEEKSYELEITGLQDPYRFKRLVWAMKRAGSGMGAAAAGAYAYEAPKAVEMTGRSLATMQGTAIANALESVPSGESNSSVKHLLRDIRTELRENNNLMKRMMMATTNKQQDTGTAMTFEKGEIV